MHKATTIRLNAEDAEILNKLRKKLGLRQTDVIRLCLRRMAERLDHADRQTDKAAI
jgi:predicted DNA-binding protein